MKKFTTFLLALLLTIPAMAGITSGETIYLNAGGSSLWDQADAKFSAYFWADGITGVFATEFGKKNALSGCYEFTVPGSNTTYDHCIFLRNSSSATSPGWNNEWDRTGDLTINNNLYTITGWSYGKWSTYTPPSIYLVGTFNSWTQKDETYIFTTNADNLLSYTGAIAVNSQFKLITSGSVWLGDGGTTSISANGEYSLNIGGGDNMTLDKDAKTVTITLNSDGTKMTVTFTPYDENINSNAWFFLDITNSEWSNDTESSYVAEFTNKNTGASAEVIGEKSAVNNNLYMFYLSEYNTGTATRARAEETPVYTHVKFTHGEYSSDEIAYTGSNSVYTLSNSTWAELPSAIEAVEVANGIAYANGVVTAEGAIEVYDMSGVVVARGNDSADLRALNGGIYIVRNGENVRKVVR